MNKITITRVDFVDRDNPEIIRRKLVRIEEEGNTREIWDAYINYDQSVVKIMDDRKINKDIEVFVNVPVHVIFETVITPE